MWKFINSIIIIEPKWSLRSEDWDLNAFCIIPILVGALPSNSLLVSMGLSKLATFLSLVRRSASSVSNSGALENSIKWCKTPNRNSCKAQAIYHFCQTENSKNCDKLEESSTKPVGTNCLSNDQRGWWKLHDSWSKSGRGIIFIIKKLILFRVQYPTSIHIDFLLYIQRQFIIFYCVWRLCFTYYLYYNRSLLSNTNAGYG